MRIRSGGNTLLALMLIAGQAAAQRVGDADEIESALLPLPASLRADASVVEPRPDGHFASLREGENGLVCETRDPEREGLLLFCYQESMLPLRERRQELLERGHSSAAVSDSLLAEVRRGELEAPQAATAYLLRGPAGCLQPAHREVCEDASLVYMLYTPGMTTAGLGLPAEREGQAPYMHAQGTVWSHVMVEPPVYRYARADSVERLVAGALEALPAEYREGAEVRAWEGESWSLRVLREGDNGFVCLADRQGDDGFQSSCYHRSLEPFMAAGRRLRAQGLGGMEYQEARWAIIERGELAVPEGPAMVYNFYHRSGSFDPRTDDPDEGSRLHALYRPGMTPQSTGLPLEAPAGQPWLMWPGKPSSHVMIVIPAPGGGG